jgi:hypothetical protein
MFFVPCFIAIIKTAENIMPKGNKMTGKLINPQTNEVIEYTDISKVSLLILIRAVPWIHMLRLSETGLHRVR